MFKIVKTLILTGIIISALSINVKADSVYELNELIENAKELDGKELTVQGEVIGERMDRGSHTWININDGTNAIGIWMDKEEADKVRYYGGYKRIGDTVKASGVFYRACREHGGEADLHCNSIEVVKEGYNVKDEVKFSKIACASVVIIVALLLSMFSNKIIKNSF